MSFTEPEKDTDEYAVVQIKGKFSGEVAIQIATGLEEAMNNRVSRVILDFSAVTDYDYTGIALLLSVLDFYGLDFSRIICCGFPQDVSSTLKGLGGEKIPGVEIISIDDPKAPTVSNLRFIPLSNSN